MTRHLVLAGVATVLLTARSREPVPDAVAALHREDAISRLELQPISRSEFDLLVETGLGGPVGGETLDRIWQMTQGNVLFARELVADALAAGKLSQSHDVWHWSGGLGAAHRLQESVAARVTGLPSPDRRLLEVLALGEPVALAVLEVVAPCARLEELERLDLVSVETGAGAVGVRLGHPLFGETLRASMPETVRRAHSIDLVAAMRHSADLRPGDMLRLAVLLHGSGEPVDGTVLAAAARTANELGDHVLAEEMAQAGLTRDDDTAARLELGRARLGQGRFTEAVTDLMPLVGKEPDDRFREELADALAQALGHGLGRVDNAIELITDIETRVSDPRVRALVQGHRATLLAFACRYAAAAELGMTALSSVDDDAIRVRSLTSVGTSLFSTGRTSDAIALSERALPAALALQDRLPRAPAWAVTTRASALALAGRPAEALTALDNAIASQIFAPLQARTQADVYRARSHLTLGHPRTASRLLGDAALTLRRQPFLMPTGSWCLALAAEAHSLLGRHDTARSLAAEAVSLRGGEILAFQADELRALAWVDAQSGRTSTAIGQLWKAADVAASRDQYSFELLALDDLLRLGEDGAAPRARAVAREVDGALSAAVAAHADAVSSDDGAATERAATCFDVIGANLVAAELWSAASVRYQAEGLRARAAAATRHATARAAQAEGARTQPLAWLAAPVALTRRQHETALLAARGQSNAQIAAALSISERTVESHLYAVFAKLGVTERNDLADVLEGR